jgi:hypothetical protein
VTRHSQEFWENWGSFELGSELMSVWLHHLRNGGMMPAIFYVLG